MHKVVVVRHPQEEDHPVIILKIQAHQAVAVQALAGAGGGGGGGGGA